MKLRYKFRQVKHSQIYSSALTKSSKKIRERITRNRFCFFSQVKNKKCYLKVQKEAMFSYTTKNRYLFLFLYLRPLREASACIFNIFQIHYVSKKYTFDCRIDWENRWNVIHMWVFLRPSLDSLSKRETFELTFTLIRKY